MTTRKEHLRKRKGRRRGKRRVTLVICVSVGVVFLCAAAGFLVWNIFLNRPAAEDTVREYFDLLNAGEYGKMYGFLSSDSQNEISEKEFVSRNQNIYEGIGASDIKVDIPEEENPSREDTETVTYTTSMNTAAGALEFKNQMTLVKNGDGDYRIDWDSTLIFPSLLTDYRVSLDIVSAKRGTIYDRNGNILASQGTVSQVGLVPGKMSENREADIQKIAEILEISAESISAALNASYVQDDTFVPLKQIPRMTQRRRSSFFR